MTKQNDKEFRVDRFTFNRGEATVIYPVDQPKEVAAKEEVKSALFNKKHKEHKE